MSVKMTVKMKLTHLKVSVDTKFQNHEQMQRFVCVDTYTRIGKIIAN